MKLKFKTKEQKEPQVLMCYKEEKDETGCGHCPPSTCERKKKSRVPLNPVECAYCCDERTKIPGEVKTAFYRGGKGRNQGRLHGRGGMN